MTVTPKTVLRLWGGLDVFYVLWYCLKNVTEGRAPYVSDFYHMLQLGGQIGWPLLNMGILAWVLQVSLLISGILLLCGYGPARYIAFAQVPFRMLFLYPSLLLVLEVAGYQSALLFLALVVTFEYLKVRSLWKRS
ncbi:hypothetical protein [Pseudomonas sp. Irchel 3E13]|uniref:hypothetical protein n=1 Tax=Pseudomonas sp. Irchel 3E13 TaxID=2008975 RepID=UPI000BA4AF86|nr:hypothetical protein [Pseudomonas sp. Irchel 3E13]